MVISTAETASILIRIPVSMKHWLEQRAAQTLASRNSEIVRCIRHEMDAERQERVSG
jgi:hypothetical protein